MKTILLLTLLLISNMFYSQNLKHMVKYFDSQKSIKEQEYYVDTNGKIQGKGIIYDRNGNVKFERIYKNNEILSETKYYENSNVERKYNYNGESKTFYPNNSIKQILYFKNGVENGQYKLFYENGVLAQTYNFVNGIIIGKEYAYNEDGKLMTDNDYDENSLLTNSIQYYSNGNIEYELKKLDGNNFYKTTYDSNTKARVSEINYLYNKENEHLVKNGEEKEYFPNGKIKSVTNYEARRSYTGQIWEFKKGKFTSYFENGQLESEGSYNNNFKNGDWTFYKPNNVIFRRINYKVNHATKEEDENFCTIQDFDDNGNLTKVCENNFSNEQKCKCYNNNREFTCKNE